MSHRQQDTQKKDGKPTEKEERGCNGPAVKRKKNINLFTAVGLEQKKEGKVGKTKSGKHHH